MNASLVVVSNSRRDPAHKLDEGDAILSGVVLTVLALFALAAWTGKDVLGHIALWLLGIFVFLILVGGIVGGIKGCQEKQSAPVSVEH